MMVRSLGVLGCALALVGCNPSHNGESDAVARAAPRWRELPDGSKFAVIDPRPLTDVEIGTVKVGVRCWPDKMCLYAEQSDFTAPMLTLAIKREEPPKAVYGIPDSSYICYAMSGNVNEVVQRGTDRLTSNRIGFDTSPWSQTFVRDYLRDNNLTGEWFDCDTLIRIVYKGSLETLATTSITRDMLP